MSSTPHRQPSPVRRTSSNSSSASSDKGIYFKVTSSNVSPSSKHALNPAAKAFEFPASKYTDPASSFSVTVPSAGSNHSSNSNTNNSRAPQAANFSMPWNVSVQRSVVDESTIEQQFEAFVRQNYKKKCLDSNQHMVIVFNLEPRTNRKQLANIFFPMGASEAIVIDPSELPNQLAAACVAGRRRVGVVFFGRKDFAMVGIEKFDNFVPNGQHQPLAVRYCGPDAEGSVLPGKAFETAQLPWVLSQRELTRVQSEMYARYVGLARGHVMVAVHGLDPIQAPSILRNTVVNKGAVACERWPPQMYGDLNTLWQCKSMSAVAFFPSLEAAKAAIEAYDGVIPPEQREPLSIALITSSAKNSPNSATPGTGGDVLAAVDKSVDSSLLFDQVDQALLRTYPKDAHLVGVHNLALSTDKSTLFKIFYPMGAYDAVLFPDTISVNGRARRSGVALFSSEGMAREAASKINNFVPHGQSRPLVARYLETNTKESSTPPAADHVEEEGSKEIDLKGSSTSGLLRTIRDTLLTTGFNPTELADQMVQFMERSTSDTDAEALAELISSVLKQKKHHAVVMSSPLSTALLEFHTRLGIQRQSYNTNKSASRSKEENHHKSEVFVLSIARKMMLLLTDPEAPRESRSVAAVLCSYFFQYTYLPGNPFVFSMQLIRTDEAQLRAAKRFIARDADIPTTPEEEKANVPWVTLVECLEEMTSLWRKRQKSRVKKDEDAKEYDAFIADFYGTTRSVNTSTGSGTSTPRTDAVDTSLDTNSSKRVAPVTPSVRPTPRRVTTRTSDSGKSKRTEAVETHHAPPQVALSPCSEHTQGISADTSVESNNHLLMFAQAAPWAPVQEPRSDHESTVYITKLPSHFTAGQVRLLLTQFGEFNKVRLCREDKECVGLGNGNTSNVKYSQLCFGFVEFVESSSAKAMIEYFRNASHMPAPFAFLMNKNDSYAFTSKDVAQLCSARTSQARNRIHDQQRLDAILRPPTNVDASLFPNITPGSLIRVRPCLFGLVLTDVAIESYATACHQLPSDDETLLSHIHIPAVATPTATTAPTTVNSFFSDSEMFPKYSDNSMNLTMSTNTSSVARNRHSLDNGSKTRSIHTASHHTNDGDDSDLDDALKLAMQAINCREHSDGDDEEDADEVDMQPDFQALIEQLNL